MFMPFHKFLPFYVIFFTIGVLDRMMSTFSRKETKPTKYIYHKWIFIASLYGYVSIVILSVGEFFLTTRSINLAFSLLGAISFAVGALLRRRSIADLGKNWSLYNEIKEGQELIVGGIYRYLKHPYYLAVILELSGVCLVANAFYSLIFVFLVQAPLLLIRTALEEKMLIGYFGSAYRKH